jgi:putative ABC transport system permease protein
MSWLRRRDTEERMSVEIEEHLALQTQENIARGMSPDEARTAALRKFGNVTLVKEDARAVLTWAWLARLRQDLRVAARMLHKNPSFSAVAIVTLALGIGPNAAIFSVVRGILLRPLVNRDEARLIYIRQTADGGNATFSIPEIRDLSARMKTFNAFGDFSVLDFTLIGLGEPRTVRSGVVGGSYFQVMGLRPVIGRLLDAADDDPKAPGAVVLTYRFWTALNRDPSVIGKSVRLGSFNDFRTGTVVGVLEPSVPYPQETEIIANIVTSAHHLSATMTTRRTHRMTDLFARLAPGQDLNAARAELQAVYGAMKREHPEAYPPDSDFHVSAVGLREELTSGARTVLLVLVAASLLIFVIACSNVANLTLARNVRRGPELAVRAALGARTSDLRRLVLAESLLLCSSGIVVGLLIAKPVVSVLARYASRYSVRALDLSLDWSTVWVAAALALVAAVLLAFVPRLPSSRTHAGGLTGGTSLSRTTVNANRKLKVFALVQIAACFLLVVAAATAGKTLLWLQSAQLGFNMRHVLAVNIPAIRSGRTSAQLVQQYQEVLRRVRQLPDVVNAAVSTSVPWRDRSLTLEFSADGQEPHAAQSAPRADWEIVSPGFFATLGLPLTAGRDFSDGDRSASDPVAIVSETLAKKLFPNGDALNHHVSWTDPMLRSGMGMQPVARRIVGVVPDVDDTHLRPAPTMTIYEPAAQDQTLLAQRLVVETRADPYSVVEPIRRIIHELSTNQPVERASTLEDIRADVLAPERLNALISGGFAGVALLIAIVGVGGVLAFSVSGRTREFGIRLALGSQPRGLLIRVMTEGAAIVSAGLVVGVGCGFALTRVGGTYIGDLQSPGVSSLVAAALVLLVSAILAAAIPAVRAARVDVMRALRAE